MIEDVIAFLYAFIKVALVFLVPLVLAIVTVHLLDWLARQIGL